MRGLSGTVEPVVLLVVLALELGPALAKGGANPRMVARAGDAELELALDASVARSMMRTARSHVRRLAVGVVVGRWRARDGRLALLCIALLNIYASGSLTFSQGDRITIVAPPVLLVALMLALKELKGGLERAPATSNNARSEPA